MIADNCADDAENTLIDHEEIGSPWRGAARTTVALLALAACSRASAQPDQRCVVAHVEGHNGETIVVQMTVVNDGKPCAMQRRFKGQPATSLAIRQKPANGALSSTQSAISYTPKPGFIGKDAFDVQWFGTGFGPNSKSRTIFTKVDVTVLAAIDEPDVAGEEPQKKSDPPGK
jgi:hypothetical protein